MYEKSSCAIYEVVISFFIDSKRPSFEPFGNLPPRYIYETSRSPFVGVMGIQSTMKGSFVFNGKYKFFNIQFKPVGFSSIFQIPPKLINDQFFDAEEIFIQELDQFHEQIHETTFFSEMVILSEKFFLQKLASNGTLWKSESMMKAANSLINSPKCLFHRTTSLSSNMSLKTFERQFTGLVGMTPKLYARIRRFNKALELKQYHEELSWLDVCVQTGYFDLMHLNRDFKAFTENPPASFFENTPPLDEEFHYTT